MEYNKKLKNMKNNDLERYKDPLGLTPKKMNFGLWYVSNRKKFRKALIIFLVLVSVVTWFITIYTFTRYIVVGIQEDEELSREIAETLSVDHEYILQIAPENLRISKVITLRHLDKYDFVAKIENSNNNYWVNLNYVFVLDGKETKESNSFILPGELKYFTHLANNFNPQKVEIKIKNISWFKVDKHEIPDWKAFYDEHLNMQFSDIKFTKSKDTGLSEKINLSTLDFSVLNNSPYNYWQVLLTIVLYRQNSIVSINKYTLDEFVSGQVRDVKISIPGVSNDITKTEIIPEVDITRDDIYMKY